MPRMVKLYNKTLPGVVVTQPDDPDSLAVQAACGWEPVPDQAYPEPDPGFAPGPVQFVAVDAETGEPIADEKPVEVDLGGRPEPTDEDERARLERRTVPELQEDLRDLGLPVSGTKDELVDRLVSQKNTTPAPDEGDDDKDED